MKQQLPKILVTGLVLSASAAIAQPTLTATGLNPVIGEAYTLTTSGTYFAPGSAGAGQTWNFATYTGTTTASTSVVSVSSTPSGGSFPMANVAYNNSGGSNYGYYKASSTAYQSYGSSSSVVISNSDPEDYLHFPFTYNNTYSDPWAATFSNGGYTFYRTGHTVVTADAYGTLITPTGTYTNVTRVYMHEIYQDSTNIGTPYVITYDNQEYLWYKDGTHAPLAATFSFTSSVGSNTQSSFYLSSFTSGIDENEGLSAFSLFPNPATSAITLSFDAKENKNLEATVFNSVGQQVQPAVALDAMQGANTITLDVSTLPEGIYFAQIKANGNIAATRRFVVTK